MLKIFKLVGISINIAYYHTRPPIARAITNIFIALCVLLLNKQSRIFDLLMCGINENIDRLYCYIVIECILISFV